MNEQTKNATPFDFQIGDVIEFCGEYCFVIENNGTSGVVNPFGETFYIKNFRWVFEGHAATFVRKATDDELEKLGLKGE